MIDQKLSHPTVVLSSRLVLLYIKTSKKRLVQESLVWKGLKTLVHDPLDLALSTSPGHTAPPRKNRDHTVDLLRV